MILSRHCDIDKDLKNLKRFPAPKESLEAWERLFYSNGLKETTGIKQYSGISQDKIYKARVIPLKENCGKSKGYRIILRNNGNDTYEIIVYYRHEIYKNEKDLIKIIKCRL